MIIKETKKKHAPCWTHFWDMHSGGSPKTDYHHIFIQLPECKATELFKEKFGRDPENVTCDCCGSDYSISTSQTLESATAYHRNCAWEGHGYVEKSRHDAELVPLEEYCQRPDVLVIYVEPDDESPTHL